ncbi:MAG: YHYH protein [Cyanobacteria bacterium J06621_11]
MRRRKFTLLTLLMLVACAEATERGHVHDETATADSSNSAESLVIAAACTAFMDNTTTRCEDDTLYVESDGLPTTHNMMVGIVAWQQQFPLPQPYVGDNAWQIPLSPTLSNEPIPGSSELFRGAIALAVNGVPIFNALNNRGVDAYLAGELDQWGGHVGRGDDYHYHTAPTHLQSVVGVDQPIAYGLDGFPIYGLTEPDGSAVVDLDEYNGHIDDNGNYHYHATKTYPYINGGMRGVVTYENGQVEPQPSARPVRPAGEPLRGAVITEFSQTGIDAYALKYTLNDETYTVSYAVEDDLYTFEFVDPSGNSTVETYMAGAGSNGAGELPPPPQNGADAPPPPPGERDGEE